MSKNNDANPSQRTFAIWMIILWSFFCGTVVIFIGLALLSSDLVLRGTLAIIGGILGIVTSVGYFFRAKWCYNITRKIFGTFFPSLIIDEYFK